MSIARDKFLTEAMGECWHAMLKEEGTESWDEYSANDTCTFKCSKCGHYEADVQFIQYPRDNPMGWMFDGYTHFSTWEGFGKLWEWSTQQEWWYLWEADYVNIFGTLWAVHPDRFADAVYEFLTNRGRTSQQRT